jgi:hypothetical protein
MLQLFSDQTPQAAVSFVIARLHDSPRSRSAASLDSASAFALGSEWQPAAERSLMKPSPARCRHIKVKAQANELFTDS